MSIVPLGQCNLIENTCGVEDLFFTEQQDALNLDGLKK